MKKIKIDDTYTIVLFSDESVAAEQSDGTARSLSGDGLALAMAHRIAELEEGARLLDALHAGGVDNWDGYDFALEEYSNGD